MRHGKRTGFTLVELLVVMSIIGILMGLLLPAVQAVRARARLTQCSSQMGQVGKAMLSFESSQKSFPPYAKKLYDLPQIQTTVNVSWVVLLTAYLDRPDLWNRWSEPSTISTMIANGTFPSMLVRIPVLICPSAIDRMESQATPCSYVVNCGVPEENAINANSLNLVRIQPTASSPFYPGAGAGTGLCFDQQPLASVPIGMGGKGLPARMRTGVDSVSVKDGASQTLLASENLQTTQYVPLNAAGGLRPVIQGDVGMLWDGVVDMSVPSPFSPFPINNLKDAVVGLADASAQAYPDGTRRYQYARPSSEHGDVVVAVYCDGHVSNLRRFINYQVFRQLMTPDDSGCVSSVNTALQLPPASGFVWPVLDTSDLER